MKSFVVGWRLLLVALHLLLGAVLAAVAFPLLGIAGRERVTRWWSRVILRIFGISVQLSGNSMLRDHGHMLLINHISWIDVYVVNSYRATRFVAKSEIRSWPLIGWLCDRVGTIFIERNRRRAVHGVLGRIEHALRDDACIGIFPEGTTSDGTLLLPFHANLIEAAIVAGVPVVPATLRYASPSGQLALAAGYIGDMTLFESALSLLGARPLCARLALHGAIDTAGKTRHQVARDARLVMMQALDMHP
jgi:1-acyl-sn-glycerol-3-phosphate acyltransferase